MLLGHCLCADWAPITLTTLHSTVLLAGTVQYYALYLLKLMSKSGKHNVLHVLSSECMCMNMRYEVDLAPALYVLGCIMASSSSELNVSDDLRTCYK